MTNVSVSKKYCKNLNALQINLKKVPKFQNVQIIQAISLIKRLCNSNLLLSYFIRKMKVPSKYRYAFIIVKIMKKNIR